MPKRFRKELGNIDKFYILLGRNGEIWGFDPENWSKLAETVLNLPLSTEEGRKARLEFFPRAEECFLDSQGRFVLPQEFSEKLGLKKEVVIIGAGDHFEIWDIRAWEENLQRLEYGR